MPKTWRMKLMGHARQNRDMGREWKSRGGRAPVYPREVIALALASAAHYLASLPGVSVAGYEGDDSDATARVVAGSARSGPMISDSCRPDPATITARARLDTERDRHLAVVGRRHHQEAALLLLRDHAHLRVAAARAVRRRYGLRSVTVGVWGPGWRDVPAVVVGDAVCA